MSNPFLEGKWIGEDEVVAFNKFGQTLARLGVVKFMCMEFEEEEEIEDGCRCGCCYETRYWTGVNVCVGDYYNEWTVSEETI